MSRILTLTVLLLAITLGSCGTRGALFLPPPLPAKNTTAPATSQPSPAPADLNTAKDPAQ